MPKVSAPQIAVNRGDSLQAIQQQLRQPFELVGADRECSALRGEIVERVLEPFERARKVGDMVGVIGDEILHHPVDFGDGAVAARDLQPALDQLARAAADQVAR